jgi:hypothetical protein
MNSSELRQWRDTWGITGVDLAAAWGISPAHLWRMELGTRIFPKHQQHAFLMSTTKFALLRRNYQLIPREFLVDLVVIARNIERTTGMITRAPERRVAQ